MIREFHIHVDAWEISSALADKLRSQWNFVPSDFAGHPEATEGFEPLHHLTYKTKSGAEFREVFEAVASTVKQKGMMRGYVEGEFLPIDEDIGEKPFDASVPPPIRKFNLTVLPKGHFRGSEIHIVMDRDRSHPQLLRLLSDMGLFSAYMRKPYGTAVIFTVGGTREQIASIVEPMRRFLHAVGGAVSGSIKEERIAAYWISDLDLRLPPVIDSIEWSAPETSSSAA